MKKTHRVIPNDNFTLLFDYTGTYLEEPSPGYQSQEETAKLMKKHQFGKEMYFLNLTLKIANEFYITYTNKNLRNVIISVKYEYMTTYGSCSDSFLLKQNARIVYIT